MSRDHITRAEVEQLLEEWSEELVKTLLKVLAPGGLDDPALAAARQRAAELRQADPVLAEQVASVAKARREGAHVTIGADPGRRVGPGVVKLGGVEPDDESATADWATAAIRRRLGKQGDI